jgi:Zn-dependent protease with chaperone function
VNAARLGLSLFLVALPAVALPAVRRTRRPRAWTLILAASMGAGFVLVELSLIHAALPLAFALLGLDRLAAACRALGGHLFGDPTAFGAFAGLLAIFVGVNAYRGVVRSIRVNGELRRGTSSGMATAIGGHLAAFMPLGQRWAIAVPGGTPPVLLSTSLAGKLEQNELSAVVSHEMAHLRHHHLRFLLLGTAVSEGLRFLPWSRRSMTSLRLALERWADESASARSSEIRANVRSALRKLTSIAPSALAGYRLTALEEADNRSAGGHEWGWPTAVSATVPLVLGLTVTLVHHLTQVIHMAGS